MSSPFNAHQGLILVSTELVTGTAIVRLALDTGATSTLVGMGLLVAIGYDPALAPTRVQVTRKRHRIRALDRAQQDFSPWPRAI
jgi:hypothetical protein